MLRQNKYLILLGIILLMFICSLHKVVGQQTNITSQLSTDSFEIQDIIVRGNIRTKKYIFEKELPFKIGSKIAYHDSSYYDTLIKNQLFNTGLFLTTHSHFKKIKDSFYIAEINVKERWFLFPLPYVNYIDRNLSTFLFQNNANLTRLNYGIKLTFNNITGRNDKLFLWLITGYNQQVAFRYHLPIIHKNTNWGVSLAYRFNFQKQINLNTFNNQQYFFETSNPVLKTQLFTISAHKRQSIFSTHSFKAIYSTNLISDSAFLTNSSYFPNYKNEYNYIEFQHQYNWTKLDYAPFPKKGFSFNFLSVLRLSPDNIPLIRLELQSLWAHKISAKTSITTSLWSTIKIFANDAFITRNLIGYEDNQPRGLDYYVIDGLRGFTVKNTFIFNIKKISFKKPMIHPKKLPSLDFQLSGHILLDGGYSQNEFQYNNNNLQNKFLYTTGIGLDVVTIYDFVMNIDYCINQLGEKGVFLRILLGF
ncbi:MAG: hypothetical protein ORN85_04335 [Sediminibacterium sp.]|nr:hypothetical protein [Sediminibacterium sp.]